MSQRRMTNQERQTAVMGLKIAELGRDNNQLNRRIAALEQENRELRERTWQRIDPSDEGTWPPHDTSNYAYVAHRNDFGEGRHVSDAWGRVIREERRSRWITHWIPLPDDSDDNG